MENLETPGKTERVGRYATLGRPHATDNVSNLNLIIREDGSNFV